MTDCRIGVGLRTVHFPHLLGKPKTALRWFEAISENYMDSQGRPLTVLESMRRDYPIALHGVSMSIGSVEGFRPGYLQRLKALADRIEPFVMSDHLCWTGTAQGNLHDLLPLPYTQEALDLVVGRIQQAQDFLKRPFLIENVSTYLTFPQSTYTEWDFLVEAARRSGCRILLDVNNVYVNAVNHGFDARTFLDKVPTELIGQVHLAGFTDMGTHLFDTHSRPVADPVWELFGHVAGRLGQTPVMIEWDEDVPEFPVLEAQAMKAAQIWKEKNDERAGFPAAAIRPGGR